MQRHGWVRGSGSVPKCHGSATLLLSTNLEESARPVGLCNGFFWEGDPADGLRVAGPLGHLAEGERCPNLLHLLFLLVPHNLNQARFLIQDQ